MSIWFRPFTIEECAQLAKGLDGKGTLMQTMGIEVSEIGEDYLTMTMMAGPENYNPIGMVHGGANVVLAETVASYAANFVIDNSRYFCVGQEINANHLKAARKGKLTAIAKPIHLGKRTSVWEIKVYNSANELTCISRMTAAVMERKKPF